MLGLHLAAGGVLEVPAYLRYVLGGLHGVLDTVRPMAGRKDADRVVQGQGQ